MVGVRVWYMRTGISFTLEASDRRRLEAIVRDRNAPHKHFWRAEIVLLTADGLGTVAIIHPTGKSNTYVWRWQERFSHEGVAGLLRDKTRPSRVKPLGQEVIDEVVRLTATRPPNEATHWPSVAMAKRVGVSVSSMQRIWRAHGLAPHRVRQFKLSNDPASAAYQRGRDVLDSIDWFHNSSGGRRRRTPANHTREIAAGDARRRV